MVVESRDVSAERTLLSVARPHRRARAHSVTTPPQRRPGVRRSSTHHSLKSRLRSNNSPVATPRPSPSRSSPLSPSLRSPRSLRFSPFTLPQVQHDRAGSRACQHPPRHWIRCPPPHPGNHVRRPRRVRPRRLHLRSLHLHENGTYDSPAVRAVRAKGETTYRGRTSERANA